jgi:hypothetical protein
MYAFQGVADDRLPVIAEADEYAAFCYHLRPMAYEL